MPKGGSGDPGGPGRGLKAPAIFDGKDSEWKEWSNKSGTYMITRESEGGKYLKWVETSDDKTNNAAITQRFANESLADERGLKFSRELDVQIPSCTSKEAFRLVVSVEDINNALLDPRGRFFEHSSTFLQQEICCRSTVC